MNKLTLKNKFTGILLCLVMLIVYLIGLVLYQNGASVLSEINTLFKSSIVLETEIRLKEIDPTGYKQSNQYHSIATIQSKHKTEAVKINNDLTQLTQSEKVSSVMQTYLLFEASPARISRLDSLFQVALIANGINANIAFAYIVDKTTQYSSTNSAIYAMSNALPAIITGVKSEIVFQVYADVPLSCLVSRDKVHFIMLMLLFSIILFLLGFTCFSKKLAILLVEPIHEEKRMLIKIKENLLFDPEKGILYYKDNVKVPFQNYKLRLFVLLLNNPEYFETSANIKSLLWRHTATTAKLNTTIKRLRRDLEPIPDLTIIFRNGGYQLNITTI